MLTYFSLQKKEKLKNKHLKCFENNMTVAQKIVYNSPSTNSI